MYKNIGKSNEIQYKSIHIKIHGFGIHQVLNFNTLNVQHYF